MEPLDTWIDRQYRHSAHAMLRSVSSGIVKSRPGFGQEIRAGRGSIVASPVLAAYDPEPDYFFHWFRDSAVVVDALRILYEDPTAELDTRERFGDFVQFSLSLFPLDGRALTRDRSWRKRVAPDFEKFLRHDADLDRVHDGTPSAETRVNPDGSLDISDWPRPQFDGPAMRALALLRWMQGPGLAADVRQRAGQLLRLDLDFVLASARRACFDIWEEELGFHYYTLRVSAAALSDGAAWLAARGDTLAAHACETEAGEILRQLDAYWLPERGYLISRILDSGSPSTKELDISVVLAAVHVGPAAGPGSVEDSRMHHTLMRLEELFDSTYAINRNRPADRAPAMGRYAGDVYFSGGAYYFSTLAAAEFCFQAAARAAEPARLAARGDEFLRTVRAFTPESGDLAEQFDQTTGVPRSARHLAWSYAAFISCIAARRAALTGPPAALRPPRK